MRRVLLAGAVAVIALLTTWASPALGTPQETTLEVTRGDACREVIVRVNHVLPGDHVIILRRIGYENDDLTRPFTVEDSTDTDRTFEVTVPRGGLWIVRLGRLYEKIFVKRCATPPSSTETTAPPTSSGGDDGGPTPTVTRPPQPPTTLGVAPIGDLPFTGGPAALAMLLTGTGLLGTGGYLVWRQRRLRH
jgi:hypothetical protein